MHIRFGFCPFLSLVVLQYNYIYAHSKFTIYIYDLHIMSCIEFHLSNMRTSNFSVVCDKKKHNIQWSPKILNFLVFFSNLTCIFQIIILMHFIFLVCSPNKLLYTFGPHCFFMCVCVKCTCVPVFRNEVWQRDAALGKFAVHCSDSKIN